MLFCEPYTLTAAAVARGKSGVRLTVNDVFYQALLRPPKKFRRARGGAAAIGNAYLFGRRFPLETYKRLGTHDNDGAQTGFVDLGLFEPRASAGVADMVLKAYGSRLNWDNRAALRRVRAAHPHILFIGATLGGDVGAALYAHRSRGAVDSLIIDNNYFFRDAR